MTEQTTTIGTRLVWGGEVPFGISPADASRHLYIIGQTGVGKTTLLENLLMQKINSGEGVGFIDPHGDSALKLLNHIPASRVRDVVYFDPADSEFPMGLNLLASVGAEHRHLAAQSVVSIFKNIWRDSWGPRTEYILNACLLALLECQNVSLLGVPRMLSDSRYREWVLRQVSDPLVRVFWQNEFAKYPATFLREAIAPIQNKVGQLLMAVPLRNTLGQVRSKLDFSYILDNRKIFIANLSKGRLGEVTSNLLGAVLISMIQLTAMARADKLESRRNSWSLFIDEFQNFSTESFASILAEARKFKLALVLSHQYIAQIREDVQKAVFGNCGSLISFRVGNVDADSLSREFGGGLPKGSMFIQYI